jgi:transcription elongation factor Elf1
MQTGNPNTAAPSRTYSCVKCGHLKTVVAQWNTPVKRWLMSFECDSCHTHQEAFVSEPRLMRKNVRNQTADP